VVQLDFGCNSCDGAAGATAQHVIRLDFGCNSCDGAAGATAQQT
jgi:hypothetical protein